MGRWHDGELWAFMRERKKVVAASRDRGNARRGIAADFCARVRRSRRSSTRSSKGGANASNISAPVEGNCRQLRFGGGEPLIFLLFCEFVLFRFVLLPTDLPLNTFANDLRRIGASPARPACGEYHDEVVPVMRLMPRDGKSGIASYAIQRNPGVVRVAIVGDSYVEGFQVPNDRSIGSGLRWSCRAMVSPVRRSYRFGMRPELPLASTFT